jgi:hypothetical protein
MDRFNADDAWLRAIGRAVLNFTLVEAFVVSFVNSLQPGYFQETQEKPRTAGVIARDFTRLASASPNQSAELAALASRFAAAVVRRNDLMHAMPSTFSSDELILVRLTYEKFVVWSTSHVVGVATEFQDLAIDLISSHSKFCPESDNSP